MTGPASENFVPIVGALKAEGLSPSVPAMLAFDPVLAAVGWRFASPGALLGLVAVPIVAILLWYGFVRRRRALRLLVGEMAARGARLSVKRAIVKIALVSLALGALAVAIARPQADPVEQQVSVRGRDIVFVLDVSRSMLSRDVAPSRLERAKLWINDLTGTLKGDRVGLVAFAGVPVVKSPLTLDYGFFRMALDEVSPDAVPRGGSLIGDAIRKTLNEVFEPTVGRYRDIILITDGEDQGSFPVEAAKQAGSLGVRLIVIGIGGELEGALVPTAEAGGGVGANQYVRSDGELVRSKMDPRTLAEIASAASQGAAQSEDGGGGGVFLNVGTGTMNLEQVYTDLIASAERRETETKSTITYRELFPYFLGVALVCLAVEPWVGTRVRMRRRAPMSNPSMAMLVLVCVVAACASSVRAQDAEGQSTPSTVVAAAEPAPGDLYNSGRELFQAGKYEEAAERFKRADQGATDPNLAALARYNLGQTLLKQATTPAAADARQRGNAAGAGGAAGGAPDYEQMIERLKAASRAFQGALELNPDDAEAARNVEIARRLMKDAEQKQQQQQQQQQNGQKQDQQSGDKSQQQDGQQGQQGQNQQGDQQSGQSQAQKDAQQHQQNADKLNDLAKQQSQAADSSKQSQQAGDESQKQQKAEQSKSQQQGVNQQTARQQQQMQQSQQASSPSAQQQMDKARQEQQAASEALEQGDTKAAEEHQRKAAEALKQAASAEQQAAEQAARQAKQEEAQRQQGKQADAEQAKEKNEEPKYNETAAQLLDKERRQREMRQRILRALRGTPQPVEKDW